VSEAAVGLELRTLAEQRHSDPAAVRQRAAELLADPAQPRAVAPIAEWVLGLALHELGLAAEAVDHLRRASRLAGRAGDAETEALSRAALAISLLSLGRTTAARREIARADADAPPSARGRVDFLHGLVDQRLGRLDRALARYKAALPRLRRDGDDHSIARALLNRGTLLAYQGAVDAALADFDEVERVAGRLRMSVLVAMAAHNAGFALGRRGAVADALAAFDRAESAYDEVDRPPRQVAVLASDRCDVYLQVGLTDDARAAAEVAVAALDGVDAAHAAEARLLLAEACLAAGDVATAADEAALAAEAFRAARRRPWAALAGYVEMRATIRATEDQVTPSVELLRRSLAAARELEREGWPVEALHARTFVGRVALAVGRPAVAERELSRAQAARGRGPASLRAQAWHATALARLARSDRSGAKQALRQGLGVLDGYTARLGATELRAGAAAHGEDLARLGLRLALADGRPWEVLRWAERWRAGALRLLPARPPADPALAEALTELRQAEADLRESTLGGGGGGGSASPAGALRHIARLERAVRDRALQTPTTEARIRTGLDTRLLATGLGVGLGAGQTLVELVNVDGTLHAVVVTGGQDGRGGRGGRGGRARLHTVGPVPPVDDEVQYLLFLLRRLLASMPGPRAAGVADDVAATAARLDELLLGPLGLDPKGGVVVVPTRPLHRLPWAALPSLSGRPVTVAPSAQLWLDRGRPVTPVDPAQVALIAGPDLPGADAEVQALAAGYPGCRVLRGSDATAEASETVMHGADLVHVAAHGRFRSDSPLFSSLRLADGALTVYDLERLGRAAATFVLPVCDAGVPEVGRGDEVLGTATALLGLGVRSVLAPLLPVPDESTARCALALHERLRAGDPPSQALAAVSAASHDADPLDRAVAATFVCMGAAELPHPAQP
jgi:tetratricopeptide (TPR) repeat protein